MRRRMKEEKGNGEVLSPVHSARCEMLYRAGTKEKPAAMCRHTGATGGSLGRKAEVKNNVIERWYRVWYIESTESQST